MSDDYLWDRSGSPDPDVERLEELLAPFRATPSGWRVTQRPSSSSRRWPRVAALVLAAAAALLLVILVRYPPSTPTRPSTVPAANVAAAGAASSKWTVARLEGSPILERAAVDDHTTLPVGSTLATDAVSRARLVSSDVGEVIVEPASRVRLVASAAGRARLALERGELQAFIVAPPGRFVVDTPSAVAVDLGCVYSLRVGDDGEGVLSVAAGWVAFEFEGRESFVPAGASCPTHAASGPGLPRFNDAPAPLVDALNELERASHPAERAAALRALLTTARPRDAMTLWHVIPRVAPDERRAVVRRLQALVRLPDGVGVDSVMRLDRAALDRWWDAFDLGEAATWREWKRPLPLTH